MRRLWVGLLVAGLSATAGAAHANPGGNDLPLRVSGSGTTFGAGPFSATVHGTHIGTGTFSGFSTVSGFPSPCGVGGAPFVGTATLTAANGDTINQTVSGTVCQSGPSTFLATGTYTITGGTGRFSTASGSGTTRTDTDFSSGVPGPFTATVDGTISFNH
jgi:hypothetical protein